MSLCGDPSPDHPRGVLPYLIAFALIMLILVVALYLSSKGHRISTGALAQTISSRLAGGSIFLDTSIMYM